MALAVYRFLWTDSPASYLERQVSGAPPVLGSASPALIDVTADTTQLADLAEAMAAKGYGTLYATNPLTTVLADTLTLLGVGAQQFPSDYYLDTALPADPTVRRYTDIASLLVDALAAGVIDLTVWVNTGDGSGYPWDGVGSDTFLSITFRNASGNTESIATIDLSSAFFTPPSDINFVDTAVGTGLGTTVTVGGASSFRMLNCTTVNLQIVSVNDNYLSFKGCYLDRFGLSVVSLGDQIYFQDCYLIGLANNPFFSGAGFAVWQFVQCTFSHNNGGLPTFGSPNASNVYTLIQSSMALMGVVATSPIAAGQVNMRDMEFHCRMAAVNLLSGVGVTYSTPFSAKVFGAPTTATLLNVPAGMVVVDAFNDVVIAPGSASPGGARLGNVCVVDKVFGNNATATRNGLPFLTITAALAAALAGDVVWVLPGTYTESITIPASVSIVGLDKQRCILDRTGIGVATDIVTMGGSSGIANMTITGSTAAAVQLRGVVFPNVAGTARVRNCAISVDHTGAGAVAGIEFTGGGTSPASDFSCVIDVSVLVSGSGAQNRFGVTISSGGSNPILENCLARVTRAGGAVGNYRAAEMSGTGVMTLREGSYEGPSGAGGADVSQATGTLSLDNASLVTANANGRGFTALSGCWTEWFGDLGVPTIGATRFFRSGTATAQTTEVAHPTRSARVARAIVVQCRVAPGGGQTGAFTLRRNGANTALTVTVSNVATSGNFEGASVGYVAGDTSSVQIVQSAASALADVQVGIEWYVG